MKYQEERGKARAQLRGHLAAEGAARFIQWAATLAAVLALIWEGLPAALALAGLAGLAYLARPGPSEELDRKTGRR